MSYPTRLATRTRFSRLVAFGLGLAFAAAFSHAASAPGARTFDVPAGEATTTLKRVAQQAGLEIMFPAEVVQNVRTNPVKGTFTTREALDQMLAGTELEAVQDRETGALSVRRRPAPPAVRPERERRAADSAPRANDDILQLNPYEVAADSDRSYGALNSNSITSFNVELARMPISADIIDQTFMNDVGATSAEDVLKKFSAGAGIGGNDPSNAAQANQPGDRQVNAFMQLRGFSTPAMQRDGFMAMGAFGSPGALAPGVTSNFDIERVEVINGPQALLYGGGGGAGGVINVISKQARLGQKPFGSFQFRTDQWGSKRSQLDYGWSNKHFAVRVAFLNETQNNRRVNVGGWVNGQYVQFATHVFNTTVRLTAQQTKFDRLVAGMAFLNAPTSDPRNGVSLKVALAQFTAGANNPLTGAPYPSGALNGGQVNWGNVDSWQGGAARELTINTMTMLSAETKWNSWLTSQVAAGYDEFDDYRINVGFNFYAPGASGNALPGWTAAAQPNLGLLPNRMRVFRGSALATNDFEFFGRKVRSQTIVGWDYSRARSANIRYQWYQADANWKTIVNPAVTAQGGRTMVPKIFWSIENGPVLYAPFPKPHDKRFTLNGVNYNLEQENMVDLGLVSPANPLGTRSTTGNYQINTFTNQGIYAVNYTQWMDKRLDFLAGFRLAKYANEELRQSAPVRIYSANNRAYGYNIGAIYHVNKWLHPYFTYSDSYTPPLSGNLVDPFNASPGTTHGVGQELGLKIQNSDDTLSGSIAIYRANAKDDRYPIPPVISSYANPSGLNGGGGGSFIKVNRTSRGVQFAVTASPNANWRMRLSGAWVDGTIGTAVKYTSVYNDQFHANSQGQVTYRDGSLVYVNPGSFSAAAPVATATTPGAVPLTITMLSTPGNPYFANPSDNGQIASNSNAALTLRTIDAVHGPILTGATLLPMSNYQLNPALTGITPPSEIVASVAGEETTGYPTFSANYTVMYSVPSGWLRGLRIGGNVVAAWRYRNYFYYPNTASRRPPGGGSPLRVAFYKPTVVEFGLTAGYTKKFDRFTLGTQLNISNVFNHYKITVLPSPQSAYNTLSSLNATLTTQPRAYVWTNTVDF